MTGEGRRSQIGADAQRGLSKVPDSPV